MNATVDGVPPPAPPLDPRTHRALGSPSRLRLLTALRVEGPLEIEQLAKRVRLHLTTVRAHLNVLLEAGLVKSRSVATAPDVLKMVESRTGGGVITPAVDAMLEAAQLEYEASLAPGDLTP